uniref:Uncharacterized protein n=1 Tax=Arion vulgaris TaxID=1028688 RepID=A0A0B6YB66_9EUPU
MQSSKCNIGFDYSIADLKVDACSSGYHTAKIDKVVCWQEMLVFNIDEWVMVLPFM